MKKVQPAALASASWSVAAHMKPETIATLGLLG